MVRFEVVVRRIFADDPERGQKKKRGNFYFIPRTFPFRFGHILSCGTLWHDTHSDPSDERNLELDGHGSYLTNEL